MKRYRVFRSGSSEDIKTSVSQESVRRKPYYENEFKYKRKPIKFKLVSKSCASSEECGPASVGCIPVDTQQKFAILRYYAVIFIVDVN
ncbi:hypothetical protein EAI_13343 [Harpegnathos saltator]|uniref:Uncharacterized protein n=1 Tax=Harpegnathos saltator TaxID=610380 RepID=E2C0S7_HARSA|nr:hypothetical protein EAI_13343 [Harpegnathos saltator]